MLFSINFSLGDNTQWHGQPYSKLFNIKSSSRDSLLRNGYDLFHKKFLLFKKVSIKISCLEVAFGGKVTLYSLSLHIKNPFQMVAYGDMVPQSILSNLPNSL